MMQRKRHGYVSLELMIGLIIVVALVTALTTLQSKNRVLEKTIGYRQTAMQMAHEILMEIQTGKVPPLADLETTQVDMRLLDSGHPVKGHRWVRVRVVYHQQEAKLVGLVSSRYLVGGGL